MWTLTGVFALALLTCVAVYIPAVQRFVIEKARSVVLRETGWEVSVERFRLRFPLGVSVRGAVVVDPAGDTLAGVGRARVHAALWPLLRGRVRVMDIALEQGRFAWHDTISGVAFNVRLDDFRAGSVALDPARRSVRVTRGRADGGFVGVWQLDTGDVPPPEPPDTLSGDWNIAVDRLNLNRLEVAYDLVPPTSDPLSGSVSTETATGDRFDYKHIRARDVEMEISDLSLLGGDISARFEALRLGERSGLRVTDGGGLLRMTRDGRFSLDNLSLATEGSRLKGSFSTGPTEAADPVDPSAGAEKEANVPMTLRLTATLSPAEIALFAPLSARVEGLLAGRTIDLEVAAGGTPDSLVVERFEAALPPGISLTGHGELRGVTTPATLSGSVTLDGTLGDVGFVRSFIADAALRRRLAIPRGMTFSAEGDFSPENYNVKTFTLHAGGGRLDARGRFAPHRKTYDADVRLVRFPLGRFLPHDSLGVATLSLTARGRGVDPLTMEAASTLKIDRFDYKNNDLGPVTADLSAAGGHITGMATSRSEMLATGATFEADLLPDGSGTLSARLDTTVVRLGDVRHTIVPVEVEAGASRAGTLARVRSGDLDVNIASPLPPDSLVNGLVRTGGELQRQLAARSLDADGLQNALPGLTMTARGGRGNFLYDMARLRGVDWRAFGANVSTVAEEPLRIDAEVVELVSGGLTVDTLDFYARHNGSMLDYAARLVNRPSTVTDLGLIRVSGSAWERSLTARVLQQNSGGETGFDFGVRASMVADTTIRVEMAQDPVLGYERWRVGERSAPSVAGSAVDPPLPSTSGGDWIEWDMNNVFRGDLHLTTSDSLSARHIAITSASLPGIPAGAIRLSAAGLDLERMLDLLPTAPEVGGVVSSDLTFGLHPDPRGGNIIAARGYLGAKDFSYDGDRLADIDADVDFGSDGSGRMALDASVELEGSTALTAKGTYEAGAVDFDVEIPAVPLALVEGLLPDGMATLEGTLDGRVRISGDPSRPVITGDAGFTDGAALVAMTGTRLGISPERIAIADSRVTLRDWGLVAPNGEKFSVNGSVNIADLSAPRADLVLRARNFQFVSSPHVDGSQIYGTALLDADITARGAFDAMSVRGEVDLAEATDIVYIVRDTGRQVKDERQHIVQFVRFADSLAVAQSEKLSTARRTSGMDVLVAVNIEEGLQATLSLDEANENRFELRGGGTLAFSANRQGDTRLTGRYTMSDGTLYYRPPLISQKIFAVADGSYIEWTGPAANPEMHLSATQTSNVRVESDAGPRDVAFEISVNIAGTLAGMGMTFDLAAPGDLAIQNQLLAMTPEAKMQQAVQLLAFNQYTAPGYTASGRAFDARNQLGDFVSREVNQWARNNLQGVDFSMDINTTGAGGDSRTDYSYSISKSLFSDRVKISIGGRVSDGEGARTGAGASHGFADNLLEDIILEYRLTRRDNFFLKLFRYNTRESILEGEVTETGGGFVFRKRMNGFRRKR